jgi:histidine triad (HIT) family protein
MSKDCMFCNKETIKKEMVIKNKTCLFLSGKGYNPEGVLVGSGVIIPITHKASPFDLTAEEFADILNLLKKVKKIIDEKYKPDGYTIGWNVGEVSGQITPFHTHLHIMPRYNDEPLAAKGIRHFLKKKSNSRIKKIRES